METPRLPFGDDTGTEEKKTAAIGLRLIDVAVEYSRLHASLPSSFYAIQARRSLTKREKATGQSPPLKGDLLAERKSYLLCSIYARVTTPHMDCNNSNSTPPQVNSQTTVETESLSFWQPSTVFDFEKEWVCDSADQVPSTSRNLELSVPCPWEDLVRQNNVWRYDFPFTWEDELPFSSPRLAWSHRHAAFRQRQNVEKKRLRAIKKQEDFSIPNEDLPIFINQVQRPRTFDLPTRNRFDLLEVEPEAPQEAEPTGNYQRHGSRPSPSAMRNFYRHSRPALEHELITHTRVRDCMRVFWEDRAPGWMMGPYGGLWYDDELHNTWETNTIPMEHESEEIERLFREYHEDPDTTDPMLYSAIRSVQFHHERWEPPAYTPRPRIHPSRQTYDDILAMDISEGELLNRLAIHNRAFDRDLFTISHAPSEDVCGNYLAPMRLCVSRYCTTTASCKTCSSCRYHCHCAVRRSRSINRHRRMPGKNKLGQRATSFSPSRSPSPDSWWDDDELYERFFQAQAIFPRAARTWARLLDKGFNSQGMFDFKGLPTNFTVNHVIDMPFFQQFTNALGQINGDITWATVLKELLFCFLHIHQSGGSISSIITSLVHFISNTKVPENTIAFVVKAVKSYANNSQGGEEPMLLSNLPILGSLGALLIVIVGCKALPSDRSVDQLLQRTGQIGRVINTYDSLDKKLAPLFATWADYIRVHMLGYSARDMDGWKLIDEWCDEVDSHRNSHFERKVREDAQLRSTIDTLLQRGQNIVKELDATRVPLVARQRVTNCMMFLNQARTVASTSTAGLVEPRIPPIVIHFVGHSGVGKSTMLGYLNTDLLKSVGSTDPTDLNTKIHYRQSMDEFWSDYNTTTEGVVCDDAFARKDTESNPNPEVLEQIHMANTAHYALNMADVKDKGMVIFRAKWVVWTTNRHYFVFPSLTNPEALYNRVSLKFHMRVVPKFLGTKTIGNKTIDTLDHSALNAALETDNAADRKCMRFDLVDPTAPGVCVINDAYHPDGYSYREMSDMCIAALKTKQEQGKTFLKRQKEYFSLTRETYNDDVPSIKPTLPPNAPPEMKALFSKVVSGPQDPAMDALFAPRNSQSEDTTYHIADDADIPPIPVWHVVRNWLLPKQNNAEVENALNEAATVEQPRTTNVTLQTEFFSRPGVVSRLTEQLWPSPEPYRGVTQPKAQAVRDSDVGGGILAAREEALASRMTTAGPNTHGYHINIFRTLANYRKGPAEATVEAGVNGTVRPGDYCMVVPTAAAVVPAVRALLNAEYIANKYPDAKKALEEAYLLVPAARCTCEHYDQRAHFDWLCREWDSSGEMSRWSRLRNAANQLFEDWAETIGAFLHLLMVCGFTILSSVGVVKGVNWILAKDNEKAARRNQKARAAKPNNEGYEKTTSALPRVNHEGYDKTTSALPKRNHESADKVTPKVDDGLNSESLSDQNAAEIRRQLFKNGYLLYSNLEEGFKVHGTATFVTGRVFLTNRHIWAAVEDKFTLANSHRKFEVLKAECSVAIPSEAHGGHQYRDAVLVECPRFVPLHASVMKHFMTKTDFAQHQTLRRVEVVGYDRNGYNMVRGSDLVQAEDRESFQLRDPFGTWMIREHYRYGVETEPGDCGSLVVAFDPSLNRKVIGMHMAGAPAPYTGVATALHADFLRELLSSLKLRYKESITDGDVPTEIPLKVEVVNNRLVCAENTFTGFAHAGTVVQRVHAATKSKLRPSPCQGITQSPTKSPAHLVPFVTPEGKRISPLTLAMQKANTECKGVHRQFLEEAGADVRRMILRNIDAADQRLLTFEESIAGIPGNPYYTPMNRSAGPGYGWPKTGKGKTHWLGQDEYDFSNPEFISRWDSVLSDLANGRRPLMYWVDTLKDELRPESKNREGKTRLFAAGEQVFTAVIRRYFLGFCAHIMAHSVDFESCVGINPLSYDWSRVAVRMQKHGTAIVAGDFTNYDGLLLPDLLWEFCDIVNDFYQDGPTNAAIRRQIFLEIVNSVHVNGDKVYVWDHSQPSGNALTVILNSIVHSLLVRMTFLHCAEKYSPENCSMTAYNKFVTHVNYGDDDLSNIAGEIVEWFNQHTMTEMYVKCGMIYTDETKSADAPRYRKLEEVAFLKRKFRWDADQARWRAPLALDTILEMCNWVRGPDAYSLAALEIQEAYYELSQHDRPTYNRYVVALDNAARYIGERVRVSCDTYEAYQRLDMCRYGNSVRTSILPTSGDRGFRQMTETSVAANPALSDCRPSPGASNSQAGGVFTPNDKCVPATEGNLKRLLVQSTSSGNESSQRSVHRLAQISNPITGPMNPGSYLFSAGSTNQESGPSFAGTSGTEVHQVLTFNNDGEVETGTRSAPTRAHASYLKGAQDKLANEITGFLGRPIQIGTFDWSSTSGALGELFAYELPKQYLTIPMVAEKLRGFRYFRCDFVMEVQVNAQPFNAGALITWFNPLKGQLGHQPSSTGFLGGVTGYPHVKYRCGDATSVQLRIPYNNVLSHFDLVKQFGTMGRVAVDIMSPLSGSADVDGTVWIWAENIDFTMPTGLPTLPFTAYNSQSGEEQAAPPALDVNEEAMEAASTPVRQERKRRGPIETASTALAMVSAGLSLVPGLQWIAAPAAVVFGAAGKIAHLYGWSKPTDPEYTDVYQPCLVRNTANYNGDSKAKVLALDFQNVTDMPLEVFNTTEDEMALANILKKPIFTDVFVWATTNPQGNILWKWPVDASSCNKRAVTGTPSYVVKFNNYLSYTADSARWYRGGLTYDLMLVKTPFHSGRIRILWVPGADMGTDPATVDFNKVYSQVHDIRTTTDIRVTVPYTWNAPWKECASAMGANPTDLTYNTPQGMLYIEVINALRAPSTAASQIEVLVFASAAEDFQYAYPELNRQVRIMRDAASLPPPTYSMNSQSGTTIYPNANPPEFDPNKIAVGEAFLSYRQWLKRYMKVTTDGLAMTLWSTEPPVTSPTAQDDLDEDPEVWYFVGSLYRFVSGPVRALKVFTQGSVQAVQYTTSPGSEGTQTPGSGAPNIFFNTALEPFAEIELPFYQRWPAMPTGLGDPATATQSGGVYDMIPYNTGTLLLSTTEPEGTTTWRQAGETFSFGFLLGPPATMIGTV